MSQGVHPQQTPEQILQSAAQLAPQLQVPQIPNPQAVPVDQAAPGISGVLTPQFADALSAQAMTGHPGQNGLSAVLGSIVNAHQQIAAGNSKNASSRASNRKSLMKQAKDAVDAQIAVEKVQQNAAKTLLTNKTSNHAIDVQATSTANARLNSKEAAKSRVDVANTNATSRQAVATSAAHTAVLKASTDGIKLAQSQLKGAQAHLLKVTKPVLDVSGNPIPPTPDQMGIITAAQREVTAVKHRVAVATVRADVVQAISGDPSHGMVGGVDISNTSQYKTLATAQWDTHRFITLLYTAPNFAKYALTDPSSGAVHVLTASSTSAGGAKLLYRISQIPELGAIFDKSTPPHTTDSIPSAPTLDIPPQDTRGAFAKIRGDAIPIPNVSLLSQIQNLQVDPNALVKFPGHPAVPPQLHAQLVAPPKTSLLK